MSAGALGPSPTPVTRYLSTLLCKTLLSGAQTFVSLWLCVDVRLQHCSGHETKENEIDGSRGTYVIEEKGIRVAGGENR
jgi:hypothetical protein